MLTTFLDSPILILQAVLGGLMIGAVYGLVAMGLSFIFGIMRVINIGHGSFVMVGMYGSYVLYSGFGLNPYLTVLIIAPLSFALGWVTQRLIIEPLLRADTAREPLAALLVTFGLWLILDSTALTIFGAEFVPYNAPFRDAAVTLGSLVVSIPRLVAFAASLAVALAFYVFLDRTTTGKALRAVGQDRAVARLMGVNDNRLYAMAFGLSTLVASIAGVLVAPFLSIFPAAGEQFMLKSFIIVVLGGLGSVPGALLAGLLVGVVEGLVALTTSVTWAQITMYAAFLAVLVLRPKGLFGVETQ